MAAIIYASASAPQTLAYAAIDVIGGSHLNRETYGAHDLSSRSGLQSSLIAGGNSNLLSSFIATKLPPARGKVIIDFMPGGLKQRVRG